MSKPHVGKNKHPVGNPIFNAGFTKRVSNPIRCGIIGLGRIGWHHHLEIIRKHGGFELAALCDTEADRQAEARQTAECPVYSAAEDLLKDKNVELAVVTTPSILHEPLSLQALKAGKHVLCEKPAAQSAAGIRRMMAAAKKAGKILTMHHNYRLNPEFLHVREIIDSGILGKTFRIKRRVQDFCRRNDWQTLRKYGGGMTGNWGIHLVDQCLQFLDSPVRDVWGNVAQIFNPGDAEDDIKAIIRGESGMTIDIDMTSACAAPEPTWCVLGSRGTLWIQNNMLTVKWFNPKKLLRVFPSDVPYAIDRKYGVIPGPDKIPWEQREENVCPKGVYPSFYDNLYGAIRKGKKLLIEPESALLTYQVLDRIRKGSPFAFPPSKTAG